MDIDFLPCGAAKRGPVGAFHIVPNSGWFKRRPTATPLQDGPWRTNAS
jgi:hypothetical protein